MPIKTSIKEETRKVVHIEDITCNMCGESLKMDSGIPVNHLHNSSIKLNDEHVCTNDGKLSAVQDMSSEFYGIVNQTVYGGYLSKHLMDTERYTFSLCEKCIVDMFDKFKHPPEVTLDERYTTDEQKKIIAASIEEMHNEFASRVMAVLGKDQADAYLSGNNEEKNKITDLYYEARIKSKREKK